MLRLRQVVVAASDLRATRTEIEDGLGLPHVWADPVVGHFGLRNALYLIGDAFLEVVSPIRPDAPAQRFLDRTGQAAGYMAIVQTTDDLDDVRGRADNQSIRIVFTAEGDGVTGLHFHPADADGPIVALDGATLEFVPASAGRTGLCEVDLLGPANRFVTIAGVTFSVS